ncbi:esterase [Clostridium botulinum]|uniref:esterase n=1 Tax=Clostridium botulinum TaxID=1491 RepID=UPI001A90FDA9|nr:esterase [Clostridium botulinum]MBO0524414.1 esterase [Clostridium botulinum]MBO0527388.1 esterase [Clostridium botulinum]MBO0530320.1 esterase [Clostridium botulinum]MBO0536238.1 esterase [Clostridium botulinum]MBO0539215.1 esterase [Clostridium botulinum]
MDLKVTNIEDLKKVAQGEVIQLPQFAQGIPFNARVKRVSLLNLVRKGVIPNKLLSAAEELFYGKQSSKENVDLTQMTDVMYIMAENALVEPSIEDLKSVGLELTDEQIVALFNYTQEGVSELDSFREKPENIECNINK